MADKKWFAVDVVVHPDVTEAVESALNYLDSLGTEIDSLRKTSDEPLRVSGYFDAVPNEDEVRVQVKNSLQIHGFDATLFTASQLVPSNKPIGSPSGKNTGNRPPWASSSSLRHGKRLTRATNSSSASNQTWPSAPELMRPHSYA